MRYAVLGFAECFVLREKTHTPDGAAGASDEEDTAAGEEGMPDGDEILAEDREEETEGGTGGTAATFDILGM